MHALERIGFCDSLATDSVSSCPRGFGRLGRLQRSACTSPHLSLIFLHWDALHIVQVYLLVDPVHEHLRSFLPVVLDGFLNAPLPRRVHEFFQPDAARLSPCAKFQGLHKVNQGGFRRYSHRCEGHQDELNLQSYSVKLCHLVEALPPFRLQLEKDGSKQLSNFEGDLHWRGLDLVIRVKLSEAAQRHGPSCYPLGVRGSRRGESLSLSKQRLLLAARQRRCF